MRFRVADSCGEEFGGDFWNWLFAGGVDGQYGHRIRQGKCRGELRDEVAGAGIAVGLEDDVNLVVAALAGGGECGGDFGGVVTVIVDDGDAVGAAAKLEAAVDSVEAGEALGDFFGRNFKLAGDRYCSRGVEDVVAAGDAEFEGA